MALTGSDGSQGSSIQKTVTADRPKREASMASERKLSPVKSERDWRSLNFFAKVKMFDWLLYCDLYIIVRINCL